MALDEYRKKRDFRRTPEPSGKVTYRAAAERLEYVIQKHAASHLHYDFRLELDGVLKSWAVPKGPSLKPGVKRLAMETEDHPMDYGSFEGVIPRDEYGGGTVMLWDRGVWIPEGDPRKGYQRGRLRFRLEGEKLGGGWVLTRMKPKPGERKTSWLLIKSRDDAAIPEDAEEVTDTASRSVATDRDLEEIAEDRDAVWRSNRGRADPKEIEGSKAGALPDRPKAQLATLTSDAPEGEEWIHELKFDGYRVLCRIEDGDVRVITRNGKDWTDRFERIAEALGELPCQSAVVDGEVVVMDRHGVSSFQKLQNSLSDRGGRSGEPLLYAFDLTHLDGRDLAGATLTDRKAALAALLDGAPETVRYSDHVQGQGPAFFRKACEMGVEGIISKRADGRYRSGRNRDWLKVKCTARQEFVIAGYTEPAGSRVGLGALLLGVHRDDGALMYAGKVGTGFDTQTLLELKERLSRLDRATPALDDPPRGARARGVHWVRPEMVAEIEFTEWTDDGRIRHPSFQGLREDKDPADVVREAPDRATPAADAKVDGGGTRSGTAAEPGGGTGGQRARKGVTVRSTGTGGSTGPVKVAGVRVSSPDKVLWAEQGVTKRELVAYYQAIETVILPELQDRPLTLVRCPSGAEEKCFYQKHANDSMPDMVPRVAVKEKDGKEPYMYINGLPSLVALVQLGVLEFHIWGSRRDRLDRPDRLVFDLDPDEGLGFGDVARAALDLRDRLSDLGLRSFPKSTGGKGLHVVVPVTRRSDWEEARTFTHAVARAMVADEPERFTARMSKSRRKGKIFVDYLRNARNATAIADYSTRARPGAPVAARLAWDEITPRLRKPPILTIRDAPDRLAEHGDPWTDYGDVRQSITVKAKKAVGL